MVSIGTSVKRQSTNFYSSLPIGYWLESENWVHFHTLDSTCSNYFGREISFRFVC